MQPRTVAAAAAAVVVAFAATGCNILTPQATTIDYDPSDGISGQTGTVEFHNAMLHENPFDGGRWRWMGAPTVDPYSSTCVLAPMRDRSGVREGRDPTTPTPASVSDTL